MRCSFQLLALSLHLLHLQHPLCTPKITELLFRQNKVVVWRASTVYALIIDRTKITCLITLITSLCFGVSLTAKHTVRAC